jgi:hypothetical protein
MMTRPAVAGRERDAPARAASANAIIIPPPNHDLIVLLEKLEYVVITATIDKLEHVTRYAVWRHHPYHYCQEVLIERYADLIAHPSFKWMMARRAKQAMPNTFGARIAKILEAEKYDRSPDGRIEGWGCKWLP